MTSPEYVTVADLEGCPLEKCPLAEHCDHMKCLPGDAFRDDPPCSEHESGELIEDVLNTLTGKEIARDEYYNEQHRKEREKEEKRAAAAKKARETRWKNREKNAARARDRKRKLLAQQMGVTERHVDLLAEGLSLKRSAALLAVLPGQAEKIQEIANRLNAISAEIDEEAKKSRKAQAIEIVNNMMRGQS